MDSMARTLHTLLSRGVHRTLVAYIMRCLRRAVYMIRFGSIEVPDIQPKRGFPQGGKLGPRLHKMCLSEALRDTWETCQHRKLGFALELTYVPFLWYSDNCIILAHTPKDFMEIARLIREALAPTGWQFPDERIQFQVNKHVDRSSLDPNQP